MTLFDQVDKIRIAMEKIATEMAVVATAVKAIAAELTSSDEVVGIGVVPGQPKTH